MHTPTETRRRYLQAAGGAALAALAGCLGDDGSGTDPDDAMADGTTDADGSMDDGMGTDTAMDGETTETEPMGDGTSGDDDGTMATAFAVTVENVSTGDTLQTMDGGVAVPLSPGVFAVHTGMAHLFAPGEAAGDGLESLAEDGVPGALAEAVADRDGVLDSGTFTTPEGADGPAPIGPGESYAFEVSASADAAPALSLATMFVQSNDLFYAPEPAGIPLFRDGEPVEGDVTADLALWDAGTEQNQPPGEGADQAPRQSGADTGAAEMASVRRVSEVEDGYEYPATADVIRVSVTTM